MNTPTTTSRPSLCPDLPVLEALAQDFGQVRNDVQGLFGLQHLFGSTASLIRSVAADRIPADRVFLLGKPYSTNPGVADYLRGRLGYWVHPDSTQQPNGRDNDSMMDQRVRDTLTRIRESLGTSRQGRLLLIDDGGRAVRLLHTPEFADLRSRFTCVEQTRCGSRMLGDMDLQVPVINVAESWVKLDHESPLIADSANFEINRQIIAMSRAGYTVGNKVLIVGYGSIGQALGFKMRAWGFEVSAYDSDPVKRASAAADGLPVHRSLAGALPGAEIVLGCTGLPTLGREHHHLIRPGALLISASSADVEFQAWDLRKAGECLGNPLEWESGRGSSDHPCFSLYRIAGSQGDFYLVNGGFPVNFTGGIDPISAGKIQLTRSLLYLGALQASFTETPGLHPLREDFQNRLMDHTQNSPLALAA